MNLQLREEHRKLCYFIITFKYLMLNFLF